MPSVARGAHDRTLPDSVRRGVHAVPRTRRCPVAVDAHTGAARGAAGSRRPGGHGRDAGYDRPRGAGGGSHHGRGAQGSRLLHRAYRQAAPRRAIRLASRGSGIRRQPLYGRRRRAVPAARPPGCGQRAAAEPPRPRWMGRQSLRRRAACAVGGALASSNRARIDLRRSGPPNGPVPYVLGGCRRDGAAGPGPGRRGPSAVPPRHRRWRAAPDAVLASRAPPVRAARRLEADPHGRSGAGSST